MTDLELDMLPAEGLIVLTCKTIEFNALFYAADFRDQQIAIFKTTNSPIGMNLTRGLRLGKKPLQMHNGIWFMEEDLELQKVYQNRILTPDLIRMGAIE